MTPLQAIYAIVERKRSERRVPTHALLQEVADMAERSFEEVRREAAKLAEAGEIYIRQTLNSEAYQPNGFYQNMKHETYKK